MIQTECCGAKYVRKLSAGKLFQIGENKSPEEEFLQEGINEGFAALLFVLPDI